MTEDVFLRTLQEKPNDDTTRLIYADWLEEQDDELSRYKAEFIRLDCRYAALTEKDRTRKTLQRQRQHLAQKIDPLWITVVGKADIERCTFFFECPRKWENLETVEGRADERHCNHCEKSVYFCTDMETARDRAWKGQCVAVNARLTRHEGDLEPRHMTVGVLIDPRDLETFDRSRDRGRK